MGLRTTAVCTAALLLAACRQGFAPAGSASLAGQYRLVGADGNGLPCCAETDSTGTKVQVLAGALTLADAAPVEFGPTPAGWYPRSCVHEIPDGAYVDINNVVHLKDGTTYQIPRCGDGAYTLVLERLYGVGDSSYTRSDTTSGLYAWSERDPAMVKLVDSAMGGSIALSDTAVTLAIQRLNVMGAYGPTYQFSRVGR